ncbi:MAG: S-methyl-5'-thioadenosine phosphorylase [Oligoflexia bacterium]|nr:S-methyl-5'-thioadenosine phosphorylase [Oligoflexia bacterium]
MSNCTSNNNCNNKNNITIGIIGGSGVYKVDGIKVVKHHEVKTPYGNPSGAISELTMERNGRSYTFCFLPRHGVGHTISPSEINYRANIFALKKMGVKYLVSVSAVGSLKEELPPKMFVLPSQFVDWTKGKRERSFFGDGMVGHVSAANPIELGLQRQIADTCKKVGIDHSVGGAYICIEGPQFSSKAESNIYRSFGMSVIGMTNIPEAYLAKEAGMAYATVAMVTDYDCWKEEHCTVEEIMKVVDSNTKSIQKLILELIPEMSTNPISFTQENMNVVMTSKEKLNQRHLEIINVLTN